MRKTRPLSLYSWQLAGTPLPPGTKREYGAAISQPPGFAFVLDALFFSVVNVLIPPSRGTALSGVAGSVTGEGGGQRSSPFPVPRTPLKL
jgi:hypothetical protein